MSNIYDLFITRVETKKIKQSPGIYVLLSDESIPLYVGKSNDLRGRVKSHLSSNGQVSIEMHTGKFYFIGIIYHDDLKTIFDKETEIIHLLQPVLNRAKINYLSDVDLAKINEYEILIPSLCRYNIGLFQTCRLVAQNGGYCKVHDPENFKYSWVTVGKCITSEMQRLLHEREYKGNSNYFYMSKITFGKLLREKTFVVIDYINEETILKFKNHFIIIDDDDTIRLERYKLPAVGG